MWVLRSLRPWLAAAMLAGVVVLVPGSASATISGPCTATLAGVPVVVGHDSADSAIHVDNNAVVHYVGESTTGRKVTAVSVHVEVLGLNVRTTQGHTDGPTWTSTAEVEKYAWAGVGLYRVRGVALGSKGILCTGVAYVCVEGRSPFLTVAGVLGAALAAVALYLLIKGVVVRRERTRGELASRFGAGGVVGGISAVILLQQFCVLPLTGGISGGVVGGSLLGMALVGAIIAGGPAITREATVPVMVPPKRREEPEEVYRFDADPDACNACKSHAAHRTYRSMQAAEADRPHTGCRCDIVSRSSLKREVVAHFPGARTVYDDRA
jgi:hypothetical protein